MTRHTNIHNLFLMCKMYSAPHSSIPFIHQNTWRHEQRPTLTQKAHSIRVFGPSALACVYSLCIALRCPLMLDAIGPRGQERQKLVVWSRCLARVRAPPRNPNTRILRSLACLCH